MSKNDTMTPQEYYSKMESVWENGYPSMTSLEEVDAFFEAIGLKRNFSDLLDELIDKIPAESQRGRLLDFGCDNGVMLNYFKKYQFDLYGVDINSKSIVMGKKLFPDFHLRKSTGINIPFPENYFSLLFASGVLKHIRFEDRELLYSEFKRVSQYLIVYEVNSEGNKSVKMNQFTFRHSNFKKELSNYFELIQCISIKEYILALYKIN